MKSLEDMQTLADCKLPPVRCFGCGRELPLTSTVEVYATSGANWVTVNCPTCLRWNPFQLEAEP